MTCEPSGEASLAGAPGTFRFDGHSDRGAVRAVNEDSFLIAPPLFLVADGMGGHAHGDRASQSAVAAFVRLFPDAAPADPDRVLDAIAAANADILGSLDGRSALSGTTLSGLAFVRGEVADECHWMLFNVGDSRVYRWDGRRLTQLTVDHSVVQELVEAGAITPLEAESHPERNVVTRALGAGELVEPDVWLLPAGRHDTFLICSDGLTKELGDDEIARIMVYHYSQAGRRDPLTAPSLPERLVDAAIAAGGSDNVTVVVVELELESGAAPAGAAGEDTVDRSALPTFLEETRPRR